MQLEAQLLDRLDCDPDSDQCFPNNAQRPVRSGHYVLVRPAPLASPALVTVSARLAGELGLPSRPGPEMVRLLAGEVERGWSMGYTKSWFGQFLLHRACPWCNGTGYGDGRAISIGQLQSAVTGQSWEIQLKGAGPTPFCREFDGRAVLRSSLREFVGMEALHSLGVHTTRALALTVSRTMTAKRAHPTRPGWLVEPVAITTRCAPTFVRVGTFELFGRRVGRTKYPEARSQLIKLMRYVIDMEFPECGGADGEAAAQLLHASAVRVAKMTADWTRVGYCQGNFQSDNCLVSGRTMDLGPFGFMESYRPEYCSWIGDDTGQFAFSNQIKAGHQNIKSLFEALAPLIDRPQPVWLSVSAAYQVAAEQARTCAFAQKLGLGWWSDGAESVLKQLLELMHRSRADWTITFRQLAAVLEAPADGDLVELLRLPPMTERESWAQWIASWLRLVDSDGGTRAEAAARIRLSSPKYVPREWMLTEAYLAAEEGDYRPLHELSELLSEPYQDQPGMERYYKKKTSPPMS